MLADSSLNVAYLRSEHIGPIHLSVPNGTCAAITGPSGSGKSLFLRMIADLDPNDGAVRLGTVERCSVPANEWRQRVVYLAAESGWWTDNLADHFRIAQKQRISALFDRLGLSTELLRGPVARMSTGERQRAALVRGLLLSPSVLLLDEPTSALDDIATNRVEHLLKERLSEGMSIVLVTHDERQAARLATTRFKNGFRTIGASMNTIILTPTDVTIATSLLVLDGVLSVWLNLGVHRQLAIAAARMVLQLVAIGYLLKIIFAIQNPFATLALVMVMVVVAAREVAARPTHRFAIQTTMGIGISAVGTATLITVILALITAIRPNPWYEPQYAIPLAGIILGNVLNAASISLDSMLSGVRRERVSIETRLVLGASFREATSQVVRESIRRGLLPVINQMSAAGIVVLPGIMTGKILAGLDPMEAVKYQILLMFLLSGGSGIAAVIVTYAAAWLLTDDRQRLRLDRLQSRNI